MQATTTRAAANSDVSRTTGMSADTAQSSNPLLSEPQNYGTWKVERRYPLEQKSTFCCGKRPPRYRESVIKCLAEYKLLPKMAAKSDSGKNANLDVVPLP